MLTPRSMFWTFSRSKHYIVKSHMDGSNSRIIISKHNPSVSLTIDEEYEKIYWWNSRFSFLKSANFDGSDEKVRGTVSTAYLYIKLHEISKLMSTCLEISIF